MLFSFLVLSTECALSFFRTSVCHCNMLSMLRAYWSWWTMNLNCQNSCSLWLRLWVSHFERRFRGNAGRKRCGAEDAEAHSRRGSGGGPSIGTTGVPPPSGSRTQGRTLSGEKVVEIAPLPPSSQKSFSPTSSPPPPPRHPGRCRRPYRRRPLHRHLRLSRHRLPRHQGFAGKFGPIQEGTVFRMEMVGKQEKPQQLWDPPPPPTPIISKILGARSPTQGKSFSTTSCAGNKRGISYNDRLKTYDFN